MYQQNALNRKRFDVLKDKKQLKSFDNLINCIVDVLMGTTDLIHHPWDNVSPRSLENDYNTAANL